MRSLDNPFPAIFRRVDPALEAASTNHLFQLFRERRRGDKSYRLFMALWYCFCLLLVLVYLFGLFPMLRQFLWMVVVFTVVITHALRRKSRLPHSLTYTALKPDEHRSMLLDLWMTECNGAKTMEAIYLERRENDLGFIKVILAMALLGTIWYYNKFSFGILQVMAWLSFTALIGTFTLLIARRGIQSISAQYHLVSNVWRHAGIKSMLLPMLRIFMIVMLFQGVVMCAFLVPWKNWNPEVAYLVATAGGFGGAILLLAFALLYRPPSPADREKLDAEANEAFEVLIREKFAEPSMERSPKVLSRPK